MPIYEYVCKSCQHPFEELVRTKEEVVRCPKCDGTELRKILSTFTPNMAASRTSRTASSGGGGCMRCGDPSGPCGM